MIDLAAIPSSSRALQMPRRTSLRHEQRAKLTKDVHSRTNSWEERRAERSKDEDLVSRERLAIAAEAADMPHRADDLIAWFDGLHETAPGQRDELFPWLAEEASLDEIRWFLSQEDACKAASEALSEAIRLETWAVTEKGVGRSLPEVQMLPETAALTALLSALGRNRRYALQSLGALGAIALTSPPRMALVDSGLRRRGWSRERGNICEFSATREISLAQAWNHEVLRPLMAANPRCGHAFAEGALMSLRAGARCLAAYRAQLWSTVGPRGR